MWVYDADQDKLVYREISYVPGLYKIFDEILVNAADNKQRDSKMKLIKVNISKYDFLALFQFSGPMALLVGPGRYSNPPSPLEGVPFF